MLLSITDSIYNSMTSQEKLKVLTTTEESGEVVVYRLGYEEFPYQRYRQ